MYPLELVLPMKEELTNNGFEDLQTADAVNSAVQKTGTTLLVINSVCGCGARSARPGVLDALSKSKKQPTYKVTTFAGFDTEAVQQAREYLLPYPPSSPCIALLKDGKLVHMIERHMIDGRPAEMISANLQGALEEYCN